MMKPRETGIYIQDHFRRDQKTNGSVICVSADQSRPAGFSVRVHKFIKAAEKSETS